MDSKKKKLWILAISAVVTAAVFFCAYTSGYGPFDRSGWSMTANGAPCYLDGRGEILEGWQKIEEREYYFRPEAAGAMATGWLELKDGKYFLDAEGKKTFGWQEIENKRYYFDENGHMTTGWIETEEGKYYLAADGSAYSGWLEDAAGKLYLQNGEPYHGWLVEHENSYYLDAEGKTHAGWLELDGARYYFFEDGTMAVGRVEIDGVPRHFSSNGKYFELVNRWNPVPADYETVLEEIDGFQMSAESCAPLKELLTACNEAGYPCVIRSGYRSYGFQTTVFQRKVDKLLAEGYTQEAAERETSYSIAIPGTSEHQLGLAVDFTCGQGAYNWLQENSWKYGFIMRYPFGKTTVTGIYYEPWHYRYVGQELAAELYASGLCMEEYVDMLTNEAK